ENKVPAHLLSPLLQWSLRRHLSYFLTQAVNCRSLPSGAAFYELLCRLAPLGHPMEGGQPEYVEHSWLPIDQYDIDDVDQWDDSDDDAANLSHPTLHATYNLCIKELLVGGIGAKIAELFALCVIRRIGASI
ncbi:hypothetical protein M513_14279, partial [Trichuris suis]